MLRKSFFRLLPTRKSASPHLNLLQPHGAPLLFSTTILGKNPNNLESISLYLKENGLSDAQLEGVLRKRQQLRFADLEKSVKPKINVFKEFGFSDAEIAETITKQPAILTCSALNKLHPSLSLLQDLLGSSDHVVKVVQRSWRYFLSDMNKTLCSNIEFLKSYGVPMERILHLLRSFPTSLFNKHELVRKHVAKLEGLGVDPSSNIFVYALWAVASMSDQVWELKLQTFRDLGFTDSEILLMFRKAPQVFTVSPEKMKRIAEAVLGTNIYTLSSILTSPECLNRSFEKRIKPRLQVLEILQKRKLIEKWPRLSTVASYTDNKFQRHFVAPYPQLFDRMESLLRIAGTR